jgi:rod shape-determining protein MreD
MRQVFGYILLSFILVLLQTTIVRYLAIESVAPDIILVWIVYLALREGQATAIVAGFSLGLAVDLLSGNDGMLGLSALTNTVAGFTAGFFHNENKMLQILGGFQFPLVVIAVALVRNILYFLIYLQGAEIDWLAGMVTYGLPAAIYTSALALLPMFVFARKIRSQL